MQSLQSTKTPFFPELDRIGWEVVPNSETEYDKNYEWYNIQFKSDYWGLEHYGIPLEKFTLFRCDIDRDLLDCISSVYVIAECGNGVIEYLFDPYHEYDFAMAILDTESGLYKEFESNMSYEKALYEKKASMYGWCVYYPNLNDFLEDTPYFPSSKLCCSLDKLKVYGSSKYIPRYVINEYKISLDEWRHIEEPPEPNLWLELTFLFNTYKLYYCEKENNKVECKVTCNGELRATWKWEKGKHGLAKKFFEYVGFSTQRGSSTLWNRLHNLQRLNKSLFNDTISKISESDDLIDKAIVSISKYGKILNEIKSQFKVSNFFIQKYLEARIKQWNQSTGFLPVIKEMSYLDMLKSASATISYTYQPESKDKFLWFATFLGYNINSRYDMDKYLLDVLAYFCYYVD